MGGFLQPPVFTPPVRPIPLGTSGQVLTMVGSAPAFAAGGGSGGFIGSYLAYASAAGVIASVNPSGGWPGTSGAPIGRLDVTLPSGAATWTALAAGLDGQIVALFNADGANNLTLGTGFRVISGLALVPSAGVLIVYTAGSLNKWTVLS